MEILGDLCVKRHGFLSFFLHLPLPEVAEMYRLPALLFCTQSPLIRLPSNFLLRLFLRFFIKEINNPKVSPQQQKCWDFRHRPPARPGFLGFELTLSHSCEKCVNRPTPCLENIAFILFYFPVHSIIKLHCTTARAKPVGINFYFHFVYLISHPCVNYLRLLRSLWFSPSRRKWSKLPGKGAG